MGLFVFHIYTDLHCGVTKQMYVGKFYKSLLPLSDKISTVYWTNVYYEKKVGGGDCEWLLRKK